MARRFNDEEIDAVEKKPNKPSGKTLDRIIGVKKNGNVGARHHTGSHKNRNYSTTFRINRDLYDDFNRINLIRKESNSDILNEFIEDYVKDYGYILREET